jgi:hypothetical protein
MNDKYNNKLNIEDKDYEEFLEDIKYAEEKIKRIS